MNKIMALHVLALLVLSVMIADGYSTHYGDMKNEPLNFYYSFLKGTCQGSYDSGDCAGYPVGIIAYYPLSVFDFYWFRFLSYALLIFIPSAILTVFYRSPLLAYIYAVSPIATTAIMYGLMAQFLVMVAFMLLTLWDNHHTSTIATAGSQLLQHYAVVFFGIFALARFIPDNLARHRLGLVLVQMASAIIIIASFPITDVTAMAQVALFNVPLAVASFERIRMQHLALATVLMVVAAGAVFFYKGEPGLISHYAENVFRYTTLSGFVTLVGLGVMLKEAVR